MNVTYKIIGSDGREYGPIDLDQLKTWVRDGRVISDTQVARSDQAGWVAARQLPELGLSPAPTQMDAAVSAEAAAPLERRVKSGASWFYWIAGLSLVNSIVAIAGGNWAFIVGLGVTQFIDAIGREAGSAGTVVSLVLDIVATGVFVMFGVFANKRHLWAFIVGMVLYAMDGLLLLLVKDWLSIGFHAFALYCIFGGLQAHNQLSALQRSQSPQARY